MIREEDNLYLYDEYTQKEQTERKLYGQFLLERGLLEEEDLEHLNVLQLYINTLKLVAIKEIKCNFVHKSADLFKHPTISVAPAEIVDFFHRVVDFKEQTIPFSLFPPLCAPFNVSLDKISMATMLWRLRYSQFGGKIQIANENNEIYKTIIFDKGIPLEIEENDEGELILDYIDENKFLTSEEVFEAKQLLKTGEKKIESLLIESFSINPDRFRQIGAKVRIRQFYDLLHYDNAMARTLNRETPTEQGSPNHENGVPFEPTFVGEMDETSASQAALKSSKKFPAAEQKIRIRYRSNNIELTIPTVLSLVHLYQSQLKRGILLLDIPKSPYFNSLKITLKYEDRRYGPFEGVFTKKGVLSIHNFNKKILAQMKEILQKEFLESKNKEDRAVIRSAIDVSVLARIKIRLVLDQNGIARKSVFAAILLLLAVCLIFGISLIGDFTSDEQAATPNSDSTQRSDVKYKMNDVRTIEKDEDKKIWLVLQNDERVQVTNELLEECDVILRKKINILERLK